VQVKSTDGDALVATVTDGYGGTTDKGLAYAHFTTVLLKETYADLEPRQHPGVRLVAVPPASDDEIGAPLVDGTENGNVEVAEPAAKRAKSAQGTDLGVAVLMGMTIPVDSAFTGVRVYEPVAGSTEATGVLVRLVVPAPDSKMPAPELAAASYCGAYIPFGVPVHVEMWQSKGNIREPLPDLSEVQGRLVTIRGVSAKYNKYGDGKSIRLRASSMDALDEDIGMQDIEGTVLPTVVTGTVATKADAKKTSTVHLPIAVAGIAEIGHSPYGCVYPDGHVEVRNDAVLVTNRAEAVAVLRDPAAAAVYDESCATGNDLGRLPFPCLILLHRSPVSAPGLRVNADEFRWIVLPVGGHSPARVDVRLASALSVRGNTAGVSVYGLGVKIVSVPKAKLKSGRYVTLIADQLVANSPDDDGAYEAEEEDGEHGDKPLPVAASIVLPGYVAAALYPKNKAGFADWLVIHDRRLVVIRVPAATPASVVGQHVTFGGVIGTGAVYVASTVTPPLAGTPEDRHDSIATTLGSMGGLRANAGLTESSLAAGKHTLLGQTLSNAAACADEMMTDDGTVPPDALMFSSLADGMDCDDLKDATALAVTLPLWPAHVVMDPDSDKTDVRYSVTFKAYVDFLHVTIPGVVAAPPLLSKLLEVVGHDMPAHLMGSIQTEGYLAGITVAAVTDAANPPMMGETPESREIHTVGLGGARLVADGTVLVQALLAKGKNAQVVNNNEGGGGSASRSGRKRGGASKIAAAGASLVPEHLYGQASKYYNTVTEAANLRYGPNVDIASAVAAGAVNLGALPTYADAETLVRELRTFCPGLKLVAANSGDGGNTVDLLLAVLFLGDAEEA